MKDDGTYLMSVAVGPPHGRALHSFKTTSSDLEPLSAACPAHRSNIKFKHATTSRLISDNNNDNFFLIFHQTIYKMPKKKGKKSKMFSEGAYDAANCIDARVGFIFASFLSDADDGDVFKRVAGDGLGLLEADDLAGRLGVGRG